VAKEVKDGIFREIDDELRHEHYAKLWKRHGKLVITLAVFLVAGVAGYKGWQSYDINTRRGEGESFAAVMAAAAKTKANSVAAFAKLAGEDSGGYALLSRLQEAAAKAKAGDAGGAAEIYRKIAGDSGVDVVYRDLAVVLGVTVEMGAGENNAALAARIAPLMADDNPWRHSAREISAALALKSGDDKKALGLFTRLAQDATTPAGIKKRAAEMARALGGKQEGAKS
jgi:hypothetical protein